MATAAQTRVLSSHTYVNRMTDLLEQIGLAQPDRIGAVLRGDRQVEALRSRCATDLPLESLLKECPKGQRVELKDLAAHIRAKGQSAALRREELMVLMLDEYRSETRDLV